MATHAITAGHVGQNETLLGSLVQRLADFRAGLRKRGDLNRLYDRLEAMDDRMLLDIGVSEVDIVRIRSGERFIPSHVQM